MSKRSATETISETNEGQAYAKIPGSGSRREPAVNPEMGEFEDAWEDEIESDEDVHDDEAGEGTEDAMDIDDNVLPAIEESDEKPAAPDVFIHGTHVLAADEVLEPDDSVYIMLHRMGVDWPSLSFDVLRDNLGDERQRYPATAYIVAGTQAEALKDNQLAVYKMTSLHKTQSNGDDSDSDEDDDDDQNLDEDAVMERRAIPHLGGVNRTRAQPLSRPRNPSSSTSDPYHVATWSETGKVHIWDVGPLIDALDIPGYFLDKKRSQKPVFTIDSHGRTEGFAMDWAASGQSSLRLLTGDLHSKIYLTTSTPSGFQALAQPFLSHTSSVEDLQWSPAEPTVFASCSADHTVQIWDVRSKGRKSVAGIDDAHAADVNVISWNKLTSYLLLSGGDEGGIKVWDLRNVKKRGSGESPAPVASFNWHKQPITSIEWHPTDESVFAASSDDQVTLWDLSVEPDDDEMGGTTQGEQGVPPQLLFTHLGQEEVKEVHWHPQIPGAMITTASTGFNIFKTISC